MSEFDNRHSETQGVTKSQDTIRSLGGVWCQSQKVGCVMMNTCLSHLLQVHIEGTWVGPTVWSALQNARQVSAQAHELVAANGSSKASGQPPRSPPEAPGQRSSQARRGHSTCVPQMGC